MKTPFFTVEGETYKFFGFFDSRESAVAAASMYLAVVSADELYRMIDEAKIALNSIPLE